MTSVPPPFQHPGPPLSRPELPDGAPPPPEAPPPGLPALGVPAWTPFVALLAAVIAVQVAAIVALGFTGTGSEDETPTGVTLVLTGLLFLALVTAAWYTPRLFSRRAVPASFGLRTTSPLPALGWTVLIYLGFWAVAAATVLILGAPDEQELVQEIRDEDSLALLVVYGGLSCFIAPACEELFFRGFMFRVLAERIHFVWAAIVAGAVFGLMHLPGAPLRSALVLGVFGGALCLVLWQTGSLIPCIMLHALHNSISFGAAKELPWWGYIVLIVGSVGTTLVVSLLVARLGRGPSPAPS